MPLTSVDVADINTLAATRLATGFLVTGLELGVMQCGYGCK